MRLASYTYSEMEILSNKYAYPISETKYHEVTLIEEIADKSLSSVIIIGSLLYDGTYAKLFGGAVGAFDLGSVWFSSQPKLDEGHYY